MKCILTDIHEYKLFGNGISNTKKFREWKPKQNSNMRGLKSNAFKFLAMAYGH